MNITDEFNFSLIRYYKLRNFSLWLLKFILVLGLFAGTSLLFVDYLSRLPKERRARNLSYIGKVKYGAQMAGNMIYSVFTVPEDDPKSTKLPVVQLFVPGEGLDRLNSNLPSSGKAFQEGLVKFEGKTDEVKVRYRGDSVNHWGFPEKSWRIRYKGDKTYKGIRSINLYLPRTKSQISDFLGYWMAEQLKMLTAEAYPIHLRLNGQFSGMRMFLEQVDENFITRRSLPKGKIYSGDITTSELYGIVRRKHLFETEDSWEIDAAGYQNLSEASDKSELKKLIDLLQRSKKDSKLLTTELPKILDVEQVLKYMALLGIVGSTHIDNTHNQKFYYNAESEKFVPIVWDTAAYFWGNARTIDIDSNDLFLLLLTVPEYRQKKNEFIWQALNGELTKEKIQSKTKELAELIKKEVEANPFKLEAEHRDVRFISNEQWRKAVKDLVAVIELRNATLKKILSDKSASYNVVRDKDRLLVKFNIESHPSFILKEIQLKAPEAANCMIIKSDNSIVTKSRAADSNILRFEIDDTLSSQRAFVRGKGVKKVLPGLYQYQIQCKNVPIDRVDVLSINGENSVTKVKYDAKRL